MGTSSMARVCLLALVLAVGSCQAKFDTPVDGIDKYGDKLKLLVSNLKTLANATGSNATGGSVSERIASLRNLVNVEGDVAKLQDTVDKLGHKLSDSWGTAQVAPELPYIEPEFNHTMEEQAVARVAVARDQMNVMQNKAHQEVADAMMASVAAERRSRSWRRRTPSSAVSSATWRSVCTRKSSSAAWPWASCARRSSSSVAWSAPWARSTAV